MTERTPEERGGTGEQSSFERRDLLKGITLGAAGFTGAGAAVSNVVAQQDTEACNFSIDYVVVVPEGQPVDQAQETFAATPTARVDVVYGVTFEPQDNPPAVVDDSIPMAYQLTIITNEPPAEREIVTRTFEEYNSFAFAELVDSDAGGNVQLRKTVSISGLAGAPPTGYMAVISLTDLRGPCCQTASRSFQVAPPGQVAGEGEVGGNQTGGNQTEATPTETPTETPTGNETAGNESA